MSGRRWKLFGERKRSAFDIALSESSGDDIIYGLQFDGIANSYQKDYFINNSGDSASLTLYNFPTGAFNRFILRGPSNRLLYVNTDGRLFVSRGGALLDFGLVPITQKIDVTITRDTQTSINVVWNGVDLGSLPINAGATLDFNYVLSTPSSSIEAVLSNVVYNNSVDDDVNSWGGATINGATRVASTDGGITWNPVPPPFDATYQAVIDYAITQGYTLPSAGQQDLQNQLVVDLKAAGVWSKLDAFSVFATDGDADFALVDWVRLITQTAVNSPTFTANQGYKGDAVSAYIDTLFSPSTNGVNFQLDKASVFAYVNTPATDTQAYLAGNVSIRLRNLISSNQRLNTSVNLPSGDFSGTGLMHLNRTNSTNEQGYKNGVNNANSTNATTSLIDSTNTRYLATPAFGGRYSDPELSIAGMGGDLSAESSDFNTAIQTYISAL